MGRAFIGNFKGPKGDKGDTGAVGPQGIQGPAGPTGTVDANTPVDFTEALELENIESGESLSVIFGKIKKIAGSLLVGAGSTLLGQNLPTCRVLVSDASGKVGISTITDSELEYLSGLTENVQNQLDELNGKMFNKNNIANNLTTTTSGKALDARQGKTLNENLAKKQNTLSVKTFTFSSNPAGITSADINCYQYGKVCAVSGYFQPNQAGTPLALGSFAKKPVYETVFCITAYERVASYGSIDSAGTFKCNIPSAMANVTCAVSFVYITND